MNICFCYPKDLKCGKLFCQNPRNENEYNYCTHCYAIIKSGKDKEYYEDRLKIVNKFNKLDEGVFCSIINNKLEKEALEYGITLDPIDRKFFEAFINAFGDYITFPKLI